MNYDINPGVGGPLRKDALWFYASARWTKTQNYVGGMFDNRNAGLENVWTYDRRFEPARVRQRVPAKRQHRG